MVGERRRVLEPGRERDRQPAAGLGVAGQHVDQRVAELLAGEPQLQHGRHVVEPRHRHRRPGVEHDDRVRVGRDDGGDELVLVAGQGQRRAVLALGLPVVVGADDDDGDVGGGGDGGGPLDVVGVAARAGRRRRGRARSSRRVGRVVDLELVAPAGLERDRAADLRAAHAEEGAAALGLGELDDRRRRRGAR